MASFEIPLTGDNQQFNIALSGTTYQFTIRWCDVSLQAWVLDIADVSSDPIVQGIPLVTGCDLLAQYAYLGIPGQLVVQTDGSPDTMPTYANLGTNSHLYYVA